MASNEFLEKVSLEPKKRWLPFYNGGPIHPIHQTGQHFACSYESQLKIMSLANGTEVASVDMEGEDEIVHLYVTKDSKYILTACRSSMMKQWKLVYSDENGVSVEKSAVRTWKSLPRLNPSPVTCMDGDQTSTLVAAGFAADGCVIVWDLYQKFVTHQFKFDASKIEALRFHPTKTVLAAASSNNNIRVYDLETKRFVTQLSGHLSTVTSLMFLSDDVLLTGGKDKVIKVWEGFDDVFRMSGKPVKTLSCFESVESLMKTENKDEFVVACGKGELSVWNLQSSAPSRKSTEVLNDCSEIVTSDAVSFGGKILQVFSDHTMKVVDMETLQTENNFAGKIHEVTGVHLAGEDLNQLIVVTSSSNLMLFERNSSSFKILSGGHDDFVTDVAVFSGGKFFISASRDGQIAAWQLENGTASVVCTAMAHNSSVTAVCAPNYKQADIFLTGSVDKTVKSWQLVKRKGTGKFKLKMIDTGLHRDEVNSIDVMVIKDKKYAVSGSRDKTVMFWSLPDLEHLHTFEGHKHGVWQVMFGRVDKIVASCSADGTVKLWSLQSKSCVKTFEAHDCSVRAIRFMKKDTKIASAGSDGLIKVWSVSSDDCLLTVDAHESEIYALDYCEEQNALISGCADGTIVEWEDRSDQVQAELEQKDAENQELQNQLRILLEENNISKALKLAIRLEQPRNALRTLQKLKCDEHSLKEAVGKVSTTKARTLLKFAAEWNMNSRTCHEAQVVLKYLLSIYTCEQLLEMDEMAGNLMGLISYTNRHFDRLSKMKREFSFVDYTLHQMKFG